MGFPLSTLAFERYLREDVKAEAVAPYRTRGFWTAELKHLCPTLIKEHPKAKTGERERKNMAVTIGRTWFRA